MKIRALPLSLLILAVGCAFEVASGQVVPAANYRRVVGPGDAAPGGGNFAATPSGPSSPSINNAGVVAFVANTNDGSAGIWIDDPAAGLRQIVRTGAGAPGLPGVAFWSFDNPVINDAGQVQFIAGLAGAGVNAFNYVSLWTETAPGVLQLVARMFDVAPGTGGLRWRTFGAMGQLEMAPFQGNMNFGETAYLDPTRAQSVVRATLWGPWGNYGIWAGAPGGLTLLAQTGMLFDAPTNVHYTSLWRPACTHDPAGLMAMSAFLAYLDGNPLTNEVLVKQVVNGARSIIARKGDRPPALAGIIPLYHFGLPDLNALGHVAFEAGLGAPATVNDDDSVWVHDGAALRLVARENAATPGVLGTVFKQFGPPLINNLDEVSFIADIRGPGITNGVNSKGIWAETGGALGLVALAGQAAPNCVGRSYRQFYGIVANSNPNGSQIAYASLLAQNNVIDRWDDIGLFATDTTGVPLFVARQGVVNPVLDGVKKVRSIVFNGGTHDGDGRRDALDDSGDLTFYADFEGGGWGIYVVTVP